MTNTHPHINRHRAITIFCLVGGFLFFTFAGTRLLHYTLWHDEYWSVWYVGGGQFEAISLPEIIERIRSDNYQAPGYYLLLGAWGTLVGWHDVSLRYFSLVVGVLSIAVTYRAVGLWASQRVALITALVMSSSAYLMYFAFEVRAYIFYVLYSAMLLWAYGAIVKRKPSRSAQFAFVFAAVMLMYTHYFALLTLVSILLYHLLFERGNSGWLRPLWLSVIAGVLFAPWTLVLLSDLIFSSSNPATIRHLSMETDMVFRQLTYLFSNGSLALLGLAVVFSLSRPHRLQTLIWTWVITTLALALVVNEISGALHSTRHLLALWIPLAIVTALGIDRLRARRIQPSIPLALWALGSIVALIGLTPVYMPEKLPWDDFAGALHPHVVSTDQTAFLLPPPANIPMHRETSSYYLHELPGTHQMIESPDLRGGEAEFSQHMQSTINLDKRLWRAYISSMRDDRQIRLFSDFVEAHFIRCTLPGDIEDDTLDFALYAPRDMGEQISYSNGLNLRVDYVMDGDQLVPTVIFAHDGSLVPDQYSYAWHVGVPGQPPILQRDAGVPNVSSICESAQLDLAPLPQGEHDLNLIIYDWQTGERLSTDTGETSVTLGQIDR